MAINQLEILVATQNPGKIREIKEMLYGLQVKLRTLDEFGEITSVEEVGLSYGENAKLKALGYARLTGLCALGDDSGLEVEALGGMPGLLSARFGGEGISDRERTDKLLVSLSKCNNLQRAARFVCLMAFAGWEPGESRASAPRVLNLTEGKCEGFVAVYAKGNNGFGFDPVFIPMGYHHTFAELPSEVKMGISHRAMALAKMRPFLEDLVVRLDRSRGHP
jgi:XTP/dITP diphosphohydrolase